MIGTITKLLFYDVGEAIALPGAAEALGMVVPERAGRKPQAPAYVEYTHPPLSFDADAIGKSEIDGFRVRVKLYDYGIVRDCAHPRVRVDSVLRRSDEMIGSRCLENNSHHDIVPRRPVSHMRSSAD